VVFISLTGRNGNCDAIVPGCASCVGAGPVARTKPLLPGTDSRLLSEKEVHVGAPLGRVKDPSTRLSMRLQNAKVSSFA
jgi:hypothetical protein